MDYWGSTAERFCTAGNHFFDHTVELPSGVLLESASWVLHDDFTDDIHTFFCKQQWDAGFGNIPTCVAFQATTGASAFTQRPTQPINEVIDNSRFSYWIGIDLGACDPLHTFRQACLAYRYQVSPAPAVASFGDVPPGHPFFQFIEALKASGITGGCQASPQLYCPDQALTRGQMAVFLSTALGLHFAP
jgi:hypothetical protein